MLHEPAPQDQGVDHAAAYKSRLGVQMFLAYALFYAGFVGISAVYPSAMETIVFLGLNLAVVYGMGLIIVALILALVYNQMCTNQEKSVAQDSGAEGGDK